MEGWGENKKQDKAIKFVNTKVGRTVAKGTRNPLGALSSYHIAVSCLILRKAARDAFTAVSLSISTNPY